MTVTRFDGATLPDGWTAIEPALGHVLPDAERGYLRLVTDKGANYDSLSSGVTVPQGPRITRAVSGSFDVAVALAAAVNTAHNQGIDLLAMDEPNARGIRFAQYATTINNREALWFGRRNTASGAGNITLTSPPNALWGPRGWMRLAWDQTTGTFTLMSSHTGKPGTWHTHAQFTNAFVPTTFQIAMTAFGPDTYGRELRIAVAVDMAGRGDDATTPPGEATRDTVMNANLGGASLPPDLRSVTNAGGIACMQYAAAVLADAPVAWWRMSETSGTTIRDHVGTNHGTISGAVTLGAPEFHPALGHSVGFGTGEAGIAVAGDAFDFGVEAASEPGFGIESITAPGPEFNFGSGDAFSFECWLRLDNTGALWVSVVDKTGLSGANGQWCVYWTSGRLRFVTGDAILDWQNGALAALNTGGHLVATYNAGDTAMYFNGVQVASETGTVTMTANSEPLMIGDTSGTGNSMEGLIDEVAIYDTALTPEQVQAHYAAASGEGFVRMSTDTSVIDSYAWLRGPTDLPRDHGLLMRYRFPQPNVQNAFAAPIIRASSNHDLVEQWQQLDNPEFRDNVTSWHAFGGCTVAWSPEAGGSAKVTATGSSQAIIQFGRSSAAPALVTPGETYRMRAVVWMPSDPGKRVYGSLRFYDADIGFISGTDSTPIVLGPTPQVITVEATTPANAAMVLPRLYVMDTPTPDDPLMVGSFHLYRSLATQVLPDKYRPGTGLLAEINGGGGFGDIFRLLTAHPVGQGENYDGSMEFYGFSMMIEDQDSPVNGTTGDWIWLRMETIGAYFRARVWYDGVSEPPLWQYEGEDHTQRGTGLDIAFAHNDSTAGGTALFDIGTLEAYQVTAEADDPNQAGMFVVDETGAEQPVEAFVLHNGIERPATVSVVPGAE